MTPIVFSDPPHMETPLGHGLAIFVVVGPSDIQWTIALDNGALVTLPQERIRMSRCYTAGRGITDQDMREILKLKPHQIRAVEKIVGQQND